MSESTREFFQATARVLLRCWIFGFVLLFIWLGMMLLAVDSVEQLHGQMFGVTKHELDVIFYCGLGMLKLAVLTLFFIPWLSIVLVLRSPRS